MKIDRPGISGELLEIKLEQYGNRKYIKYSVYNKP